MDSAGSSWHHPIIVNAGNAGTFDQAIDRKPTDLAAMLNDAAEDVRPFVNLRKQTLVIDVPADLGTVDIEAPKIRDCVSHLLLNAVKFTPDGGQVTLRFAYTQVGGKFA